MEAIKKTWNGFFATRRLDQLWYELQNKKTRNQPFHSEFKQFVGEFLQEVTDQPELPAINDIFGYREAFLELIMEQISQSYTE
jgi:fructosamine-3-kinase